MGRAEGGRTVGVAPAAQWVACEGLPDGRYSNVSFTACADWLVTTAQPDIIVNPWQLPTLGCDSSVYRIVAIWRLAEMLPIFAAGNNGPQSSSDRSPGNFGFSVGASIPVGDSAKGLGSGSVGSSFDVSAGFSPAPKMGVSAGVGHSFSDFSVRSTLNGTAAGWGDISAWGDLTDQLSISGGYDRDIGPVDSVYGRSSSISVGMSYNLIGDTNLGISAARGLTGASPLWSFSLGFGTAIPSMGGVHNAINQLAGTFGGGNHGLSKKGASGSGTTTRRRGRTRI